MSIPGVSRRKKRDRHSSASHAHAHNKAIMPQNLRPDEPDFLVGWIGA
jgi:hypothetical protein